jgi:hypothetical protein
MASKQGLQLYLKMDTKLISVSLNPVNRQNLGIPLNVSELVLELMFAIILNKFSKINQSLL